MKLHLAGIFAVLSMQSAPAEAITIEQFQGATLETHVTYDMRIRRAERTFDNQLNMAWKLKLDADGQISGEITRTVTTPRGPFVQTAPLRARLGVPGSPPAGGHGVWLVDGDKLVLLRAFESGGLMAEIEFSGTPPDLRCTIRAPFMREQGKEIRTNSVAGGPVTVLNAVQKSADCKLTRQDPQR